MSAIRHNQWSQDVTLKKAREQLNSIGVTLRVENDKFILRMKKSGCRYITKDLCDALDIAHLISNSQSL